MMAMTMTNEILSLIILTALTVIGFMTAINARGVTRISLSYLLATFLLAVNVFAIVQYVNSQVSVAREQEYRSRLEQERDAMTKKLNSTSQNAELLREKEIISDEILQVESVLREAIQYADEIGSLNLLDYTLTYDQKVARAARIKRAVQQVQSKYSTIQGTLVHVKDASIDTGFEKLTKSALYGSLYYSAADSEQEAVREGIMRSNAQAAKEIFRDAQYSLNRLKK